MIAENVEISIWDSIVLGVVEGLTEFLPVSSTGHLTIAEGLLGLPVDHKTVTAYTGIIQFGAIVATFLFFREDIVRLAKAWFAGLFGGAARANPDYRFAWYVIAGSTPIVVVALLFKDIITNDLRSLYVVAIALILWSAVIWYAERNATQEKDEEQLTLNQVLFIGFMQCIALIPGVSRSGATISAGLMLGATRVAATRLSFFLAIPALTGATVYGLKDVDWSVLSPVSLIVGVVVSFVVAYATVAWLLKFVVNNKLSVFITYRIVLGVVVLLALTQGWLQDVPPAVEEALK